MMTIIFITIFILFFAYIIIVPVIISFSLDSSLSSDLRIKLFPFDLNIQKNGKKIKRRKIDFVALIFNEFRIVKHIVCFCLRFSKSLMRHRYHYVNVSLRGGFGSPDITGIVSGAIQAVQPALGKKITIVYYPDMMAQSINLNLNAQTEIRIYSVLAETLPLVFNLPILNIAKIFNKLKKGEYYVRTT